MAEGTLVAPPDSTGKALRTQTGGANMPASVHQEVTSLADASGYLAVVNSTGELATYNPDAVVGPTNITTTDAVVAAPAGDGTLRSGASTAGSLVAIQSAGGDSAWNVQITGLTSGTLYFEGSMDSTNGTDGNWISLNGRQTGILNTVLAGSATANGYWRGNTSGCKWFRVRAVGAFSGPAAIIIRLSGGLGATFLNAGIPPGSDSIGAVQLADSTTKTTMARVAAASTAAVAADPALVVTQSPNSVAFIQGAAQAATAGTITTASTTVTTGALPRANTITVLLAGTYAGINVTFEASYDNSIWFPIQGVRDDSGIAEYTSGVLPANQSRTWVFAFPGYVYFRVRTTAWTSGSAPIVISPGTLADPPLVSAITQSPPRTSLVLATADAGVTAGTTATAALITMAQSQRGYVALGSASSFALSTGKVFRVQSFSLGLIAKGALIASVTAVLRYNPTGAVVATSPVVATLTCGNSSATINSTGTATIDFGDGKDLPAGTTPGQVGVSIYPVWATTAPAITCSVEGYEFG